MTKKKRKIINKYCWIGVPSFIVGLLLWLVFKQNFAGGLLIGIGLAIIILNLSGRLRE